MKPLVVDLYSEDAISSFSDAYAAGVRAVILKATEGATYRDHTYASRLAAARAAGMLVGSYHFMRWTPVDTQLANFLAVADPSTLLVMDWETNDASPTMAREFLEKLDAKIGRKTVVYSYQSFLLDKLGSRANSFWGSHPLWIAAYRKTPPELQASWKAYWLWQYSENGMVPGIPGAGGIDCSTFDGDEDALRTSWLNMLGRAEEVTPMSIFAPKGSAVTAAIQQQLSDLGYPPGLVDGVDGPMTQEAIRKFRINNAELITVLGKDAP